MFCVFIDLFNIWLNRSPKSSSGFYSACFKIIFCTILYLQQKGWKQKKAVSHLLMKPLLVFSISKDSKCVEAQFANFKQVTERLKTRGGSRFVLMCEFVRHHSEELKDEPRFEKRKGLKSNHRKKTAIKT